MTIEGDFTRARHAGVLEYAAKGVARKALFVLDRILGILGIHRFKTVKAWLARLSRRSKLLDGIDVARSTGVEIGALCRPFVRRGDGRIYYVDHADTASLREKYRGEPDVDVNRIVDVDVVWGDKPLVQMIPEAVDYVVASHVVEHVPDLLSWLLELSAILRPGTGEIRLIVPDRRFTFDYIRAETRLDDVVSAYAMKPRVPLPNLVQDYFANVVKVDAYDAWNGTLAADNLQRHHSLEQASTFAREAMNGVYHDIHCWVFTPRSFMDLMMELVGNGFMTLECTRFFDTAPNNVEFFVGMRPSGDKDKALTSWQSALQRCAELP